MKKISDLSHRFVEFIPEILEDGVLYVSIEYATAAHKCFCGCGNEVITPLTPTDWKIIFNGESVSIYPSIGNWSFSCRSHYWIENNKVIWSWKWTQQEIDDGRAFEALVKKKYYSQNSSVNVEKKTLMQNKNLSVHGFFQKVIGRLF